jgi:hypothetical protein
MTSDDMERKYVAVLQGLVEDVTSADFKALWTAFGRFACIPVDDVVQRGVAGDDELDFTLGPADDPGAEGSVAVLARRIQRRDANVMLNVIVRFSHIGMAEDVWTLGVGGSEASVRAFIRDVEGGEAFRLLRSAPRPTAVELLQERIE